MKTRRFAAAATVVLFCVAGCRRAPVDLGACSTFTADPGKRIAACTVVLKNPRLNDTDLTSATIARARAYATLRQFDRARADLEDLIAKQPRNAVAYDMLGEMELASAQLEAARADFEHELEIDPASDAAYTGLGKALEAKGDMNGAQENFSRAIAMQPKNASALSARCWLRAIIGRELDGALSDCDSALLNRAADPDTLSHRAFVQFRRRRFAEAIGDADSAIVTDRSNAASWYIRGLSKLATGDTAGADNDLANARKREPKIAERFASYGIPMPLR